MTALSLFECVVADIRCEYEKLREAEGLPQLATDSKRLQWTTGRIAAKAHKTAPYVAWVRGGGKIDAPQRSGELIALSHDGTPITSTSVLYGAREEVVAVICGTTERETELMWFAVVRAARASLGTNAGPSRFNWATQEEDSAGLVLAGHECVLQYFEWSLPVPREVRPMARIASTSHDDQLHGAGTGTHTDVSHDDE
jgi:hypothetical protein